MQFLIEEGDVFKELAKGFFESIDEKLSKTLLFFSSIFNTIDLSERWLKIFAAFFVPELTSFH